MAKVCPICGQQTDEQYVFCGYCGAPLDRPAVTQNREAAAFDADIPDLSPQVPAPPAARKKNHTALFIAIGAAAVIVIVAVVLLVIFLRGGNKLNSPQEVLDHVIDTALDGDFDKMFDCIYEYRYSEENKQAVLKSLDELSGFDIDSFKSLGIDKETVKALLSFHVDDQDEASPHDAEEIRKDLEDSGVTTDPIQEIVKADVKITLMGESQNVDLFFVKTDDGWYLLGAGAGDPTSALDLGGMLDLGDFSEG